MKLQPSAETADLQCLCDPRSQPSIMANEGVQEAVGGEKEEKETVDMTEEAFLKDLYLYMTKRDTPIERVPHLGFKQIDLFLMYKTVKDLGGYNQVTTHQLWKQVYNTLGGNPRSTSAATCTRRHYEKLLLPYECYLKGGQLRTVVPAQKRSPSDALLDEGGVPGPLKRRLLPMSIHHQVSRSITNSHLRVITLPVHYSHYYHPSYPVLPPYVPMPPSLRGPLPGPPPAVPRAATPPSPPPPPPPQLPPSPPAPTQPQVPYLPASPQKAMDAATQSLEHLRYLAQQYKSSVGLTEPLNLSVRAPRAEVRESPASSFAPPPPSAANKNPKFLNKPSPLYPERRETTSGDQGSPPRVKPDPGEPEGYRGSPPPYPFGAREDTALNLRTVPRTCASESPPSSQARPQRTPPPSPEVGPRGDLSPRRTPEERGDALDLGARLHFPRREGDEGGKTEVQIPLSVLRGWIRLISASASGGRLFPGEGVAAPDVPARCMDSGVSPFSLRTQEGSPRQKDPAPNPTSTGLLGHHHHHPYPPIPGYLQPLATSTAFLKDAFSAMSPGWDPPRDVHRTPGALTKDLRLRGRSSPPAVGQDFQGGAPRLCPDATPSPGEEDAARKGTINSPPSSSTGSSSLPQLTSEEIIKLKRIISCSP